MSTSTSRPTSASLCVGTTYDLCVWAGSAAFAASILQIMPPIGGAIFGLSATLADKLGNAWSRNALPVTDTTAKTQLTVLIFFGSIVAAYVATALVGFKLTFEGAIVMTVGTCVSGCLFSLFQECISGRTGSQRY